MRTLTTTTATTSTLTTTTTTTITERSSTTSSAAPVTETTSKLDQKITEDTVTADSITGLAPHSSELHVTPSMVKAEANTDSEMNPTIVIVCVIGVVALVSAIITVWRRLKKSKRTSYLNF